MIKDLRAQYPSLRTLKTWYLEYLHVPTNTKHRFRKHGVAYFEREDGEMLHRTRINLEYDFVSDARNFVKSITTPNGFKVKVKWEPEDYYAVGLVPDPDRIKDEFSELTQ